MGQKLVLSLCFLCGMLSETWSFNAPVIWVGFGTHGFQANGTTGAIALRDMVLKSVSFNGEGNAYWIITPDDASKQFPLLKDIAVMWDSRFKCDAVGEYIAGSRVELTLPRNEQWSRFKYAALYGTDKNEIIAYAKIDQQNIADTTGSAPDEEDETCVLPGSVIKPMGTPAAPKPNASGEISIHKNNLSTCFLLAILLVGFHGIDTRLKV